LDIDFFKNVNDKHGHDVGDQVIKRFSTLIERSLRKVDLLARIGGEEFAVILPQTSAEGAKTLLERIRKTVEDSTFEPRITCSIGVAESRLKADDLLFKCADKALYDAKESGRNRVCVYVYE
jgi:diguanylate cyclase (GGDEF)-like protein